MVRFLKLSVDRSKGAVLLSSWLRNPFCLCILLRGCKFHCSFLFATEFCKSCASFQIFSGTLWRGYSTEKEKYLAGICPGCDLPKDQGSVHLTDTPRSRGKLSPNLVHTCVSCGLCFFPCISFLFVYFRCANKLL